MEVKKKISFRLGKRIRKKKIINETKKVEEDFKKMIAYPIADLTLTSKIYEMLQMFLSQKQIKKGNLPLLRFALIDIQSMESSFNNYYNNSI